MSTENMRSATAEGTVRAHVLVADRHALFRLGMIALLRETRPGWNCEEADSVGQVRARVDRASVVLLDLSLPDLGGIEGLSRLCAPSSRQRFVALSDDNSRATMLECLAAGADGYILKSASMSQFLRALDTIVEGGVYTPVATQRAVAVHPPNRRELPERDLGLNLRHLTGRQQEVFRLLAEGCATKTIARRLDLGVGTVKVHLAAIYRSLDAHSRLEALARAHRVYAVGS
jgi:DNA-binding NarL/FixJ family response regulator